MAAKLSGLSSLKLARLKRVAVATGINSSGTKAELTDRLLTELLPNGTDAKVGRGPTKAPGQQRIVSIDMGIRNLAYCVLAVPSTPNQKPKKTSHKPSTTRRPLLPVVEAWTRTAVVLAAAAGKASPALTPPEPCNSDPPGAPHTTANARKGKAGKPKAKPKESFDPATYASHASALISSLLDAHEPSTILIERQRYRSMGGAAVQEWTLRVNMFEAMLHAVLETLGREGRWGGEVWAVSPGKVASFWVGGDGKEDGKVVGKKRGNKGVKIDVVGGWLVGDDDDGVVRLEGQAEGMGRAFLRRWRGVGRKRGVGVVGGKGVEDGDGPEGGEAVVGKLDDLADCLLQGVAWVKWQENRRLLVEGGLDSLDGLD